MTDKKRYTHFNNEFEGVRFRDKNGGNFHDKRYEKPRLVY